LWYFAGLRSDRNGPIAPGATLHGAALDIKHTL
jgi:hypothetical protein